jgi:hemoglobin-like flavoprotein
MGKDDNIVHKSLIQFVREHAELGVKCHQYGEIFDVLFWTIQHCLGPEIFTEEISLSWKKVRCTNFLLYYRFHIFFFSPILLTLSW